MKNFNIWLENRINENAYSVREILKNALANMQQSPQILWQSLNNAREQAQDSPKELQIINDMVPYAEKFLQDMRNSRLPNIPSSQMSPEQHDVFMNIYNKYYSTLYSIYDQINR